MSALPGRALDLAAGRVRDAEALIDALEDLRTTLDRYAYFRPAWRNGRQFVASTLHTKLAVEFGAVRSASLKLGGQDVGDRSRRVDTLRERVFDILNLPQAGLTPDESKALKEAVEGLQVAAERATGRKRRLQWFLLSTFFAGVVFGFVVDVVLRAAFG